MNTYSRMLNLRKGDIIRSYDFPHTRDCYVEGKIFAIDRTHILIEPTVTVFEGQQIRSGFLIRTRDEFDGTNRIEVVA